MLKFFTLLLALSSPIARADAPVIWSGTTAKWLPAGLKSAGMCKLSAAGVMTSGQADLTTNVTGLLPLANGGSNKNMTPVNGGVVWTDADSMEVISAGTSGQMLQSNGAAAPSWVTPASVITAHSGLTGLTTGDDHTQYAILAGRSGGQVVQGDTASGGTLKLQSTSHGTKGKTYLSEKGTAATSITIDESGDPYMGFGTTSPASYLDIRNPGDDYAHTLQIRGSSGLERWMHYVAPGNTYDITLYGDTGNGISMTTTGILRLAGATLNSPAGSVQIANKSGNTTIPTLALKKLTSQSGDFIGFYDTDAATLLARVAIDGKGTFSNLAATGLSTGIAHVDSSGNFTSSAVDLSGSEATGTLAAARMPALTGDVTTSAGAVATTIGAGKVTNAMLAGSIDLTAKVTGALPIGNGGTGQTTKAAAFDALSPMTTSGDIIYGGASGTGTRLAKGTDGQYLKLVSGVPAWAAASSGGTPSTVVCRQSAGAGSTNTAVRRYTNCTTSGSDITVSSDSTTNGRSFTIATAGTYSIHATDFASTFAAIGITVDGNALTTAPTSLAIYPDSANGMLGGYCSNFSVGQPFPCAATYYFTVNQVIRVQCSNCGAQSNDSVSVYLVGPI